MNSALLLFLSPIRGGAAEWYTGEISGVGKIDISGAETNEAPCKYLFHCAAANRDRISTVLCIVSEQVMRPDPETLRSGFDCFRDRMTDYLKQSEDPDIRMFYDKALPQFLPVPYDYDPAEDGQRVETAERAAFIYRQIAGSIRQRQFEQLYIDYTGGFRDAGFLLTELSRFLGFIDIPCRQIVYSNYSRKKILSLKGAYEMFPILSGISSFINTGNARDLQKAYQTKSDPVVNDLLEQLVRFAQAVSVCATGELEDTWARMEQSLCRMEQVAVTPQTDVTILMLQDFLPRIRSKFHIRSGSAAPSYLHLIKWCMDNGMLQQAMTLFTEKIPEICFENDLLSQDFLDRSEKNYAKKERKLSWVATKSYALHTYLFNVIAADPRNTDFIRFFRDLVWQLDHTANIRKALERAGERQESRAAQKALRRFTEFVQSNFDMRTGRVVNSDARIYDKTLGDYGTTLRQAAQAMAEERERRAADCFMQNDFRRFSALADLRSESVKRCALEILGENNLDVSEFTQRLSCRQLHELMRHCFIIKMLRNQISHALDEDELDYRYCIRQGIFSSGASLYETSLEALKDAMYFLEMFI